VNAWGAIGYGYKSPLVFVKGSGKTGALIQKDYLEDILELKEEGRIKTLFALEYGELF
jgi:hypothetical protein